MVTIIVRATISQQIRRLNKIRTPRIRPFKLRWPLNENKTWRTCCSLSLIENEQGMKMFGIRRLGQLLRCGTA